MLNEVRDLGFEYAELGHGVSMSLYPGIQQAVRAGEIKVSSVHNFFPLPLGVTGPAPDYYLPSSLRETERTLAARHTVRSIDCAAELGATAVVMHCGMVGMRDYTRRLVALLEQGKKDSWRYQRLRRKALRVRERRRQPFFDQVCRTMEKLVPHARDAGIRLGLETRFGIGQIPNEQETAMLIERFGADTIAYWHDVGHGLVREELDLLKTETVLEQFRGRTAGMHLQDFIPPAEDHLPPGQGAFDFSRLKPFLTDKMTLAWEIHPRWNAEKIAAAVAGIHPELKPLVTA